MLKLYETIWQPLPHANAKCQIPIKYDKIIEDQRGALKWLSVSLTLWMCIYYFSSKMNTEKGRVIYKFEVDRVTIWRTRRLTPKTAHTICVCNRLLFYNKCIGFTICLIYSDKLMYITQCEVNVELPNLWYTVVLLPQKRFFEWFWVCRSPAGSFYYKPNSKRQAKNPSNSLKKPLLRQKDDNILQVS